MLVSRILGILDGITGIATNDAQSDKPRKPRMVEPWDYGANG